MSREARLMDKRLLSWIEYVFTVLALVLYSGGPLTVILTGGHSQGEEQAATQDFRIMQLLFAATYLIFMALLALRWRRTIYVLRKNSLLWCFVGFIVVSALWSFEPSVTLRRSIAIVGTTAFGLYISSRYTLKEQLEILGWTFGIITLLSWVYGLLLPSYGIMSGVHEGSWRGIYTHKNGLGREMVSAFIIFLLLLRNGSYYWLKVLGLCASFSLLLLSNSKTALVIFPTMLLVVTACYMLRLYYKLMVVVISSIALTSGGLLLILVLNSKRLLALVGKDLTLTGRTDIWMQTINNIGERPFLGYGYQGFWRGWNSESSDILLREGWLVNHAHNGFLELCLELGLLGLVIFLLGFCIVWVRSIRQLRMTRRAEQIWPVVFIAFMVLSNLTETSLVEYNSIHWVLYVAIGFSVSLPRNSYQYFNDSQPLLHCQQIGTETLRYPTP